MIREAHNMLNSLQRHPSVCGYCMPYALHIVEACARWRGMRICIESTVSCGERCFRISLRDEKARAA